MINKLLKQALTLAAGACLVACSPASPKIDREILDEQGLYESEKIENIELKIIAAKEDSDKFKNLTKIVRLNISIAEKKLKALDLEKLILKEREKLYVFIKNQRKKNEVKNMLLEIKKELIYQGVKLEYLKAKQNDLKNLVKLKEQELDLKISQRFLEKAKIARHSKSQDIQESSPQINLSGYELNCKEKERTFARQKSKREQTLSAMKKAEVKFKPLLKGSECESVKKLMRH